MIKEGLSGVILAGGASSRFGSIVKSRVTIDGKSIISRIIDTLSGIFQDIYIITNYPDVFSEFSSCIFLNDEIPGHGPMSGIHAALKAGKTDSIFVFAGDMPLLSRELILKQIEFYENNPCDVLLPMTGGFREPLHAIYNRSVLPVLEVFLNENRNAINEFLRNVNTVDFLPGDDFTTAFTNINYPSDIPAVEKLLEAESGQTRLK